MAVSSYHWGTATCASARRLLQRISDPQVNMGARQRIAIHHNDRDFPDPDRFNPNRFLKSHPDAHPFPGERGYMTFGWGRRVCSGQALAEQGTWLTVARLVRCFRIEAALNENGKPISVNIFDYT